MKIYSALIKKNNSGQIEDVVLLKEGFSWAAFFFSGLWFMYHKMWREFLVLFLINSCFAVYGNISSNFDKVFLEISFIIIIALNANYWLCEHLKKKGYEFVGLVFGADMASAKLRFVKNLEVDFKPNEVPFDDSILNPKLHRKMLKLQKNSPAL